MSGSCDVAQKSERWLDHTGLNLIRIVIGSYFMAISLGMIHGVDRAALFAPALPAPMAQWAGSALLFGLSLAFMSGLCLRLSALTLGLFVLASSVAEHFLFAQVGTMSFFWRDLALVGAVLLSYSALRRREIRQAALFMRRNGYRVRRKRVLPRRVSPHPAPASGPEGSSRGRAVGCDRALRPLIAPMAGLRRAQGDGQAVNAIPLALPAPPSGEIASPSAREDDEIENIFANL